MALHYLIGLILANLNLKFWKRKPLKPVLLQEKYRVIPAFSLNGIDYYQFDSAFDVPAGRAMNTLTIFEEFNMRCTADYLDKHVRATDVILSGVSGKIDLNTLRLINNNLKERLAMVQMPEHIYKLASVLFFDKTESPYSYDFAYNEKKIAAWKHAPDSLDFFLKTPFRELIPSLRLPPSGAKMFFKVADEADKLHRSDLQAVLSKAQ